MRSAVLLFATALLVASCGKSDAPVTSEQTVTVTFRVKTGDGVTTEPITTVLVATKPGRTAIVAASADEAPKGTISGQHRFPQGVTAPGILAYYEGLLRNAGWDGTDLQVERGAGRMQFLRASSAHGWATGKEVELRFEAELR